MVLIAAVASTCTWTAEDATTEASCGATVQSITGATASATYCSATTAGITPNCLAEYAAEQTCGQLVAGCAAVQDAFGTGVAACIDADYNNASATSGITSCGVMQCLLYHALPTANQMTCAERATETDCTAPMPNGVISAFTAEEVEERLCAATCIPAADCAPDTSALDVFSTAAGHPYTNVGICTLANDCFDKDAPDHDAFICAEAGACSTQNIDVPTVCNVKDACDGKMNVKNFLACVGPEACGPGSGNNKQVKCDGCEQLICDNSAESDADTKPACSQIKAVSPSGSKTQTVICQGINACYDGDAADGTPGVGPDIIADEISCSGINACKGAEKLKSVDGTLDCFEMGSCTESSNIVTSNVTCTGAFSCSNSTIKFSDVASCEDENSCSETTFDPQNGEAIILCKRPNSCANMTTKKGALAFHTADLDCEMEDACIHAVVYTDVRCLVDMACNGLDMLTPVGDVICDDESACNNTYFRSGITCCGSGCANANTAKNDDGTKQGEPCDKAKDDNADGLKCWQCGKASLFDILRTKAGVAIAAVLVTLFVLGLIGGGLAWFFCKKKGPAVEDLDADK